MSMSAPPRKGLKAAGCMKHTHQGLGFKGFGHRELTRSLLQGCGNNNIVGLHSIEALSMAEHLGLLNFEVPVRY